VIGYGVVYGADVEIGIAKLKNKFLGGGKDKDKDKAKD